MKTQHTHRDGDTMVLVSVETRPAVIDFADILEATQVVPDEFNTDAPWEHFDGWEHEAKSTNNLPSEVSNARGECWNEADRESVLIRMEFDADLFKWYRDHGASKQVARELVAQSMGKRLDQLTGWYSHGWQWWGVKGKYHGVRDSVWGIDDEEYAENRVRSEIAHCIAAGLEAKGYTVRYLERTEAPRQKKQPGNVNLFNRS